MPGGTFLRSYDAVTYTDSGYPATVAGFRLDRYEVTVARFRAFVSAGQGTQSTAPSAGAGQNPSISGTGWQAGWSSKLPASTAALKTGLSCHASYATFTDLPGSNDARPINCVTWYEAFAFCIWDGGRIPTEAEWNHAAAGGSEQRVLPWSVPATQTTVDHTFASYYLDAVSQCYGDGVPGCSITDLVGAGSLPKGVGRFGNFELSGNVWEWAFDTYQNPYPLPCTNCVATSGSARVMRGGSFFGNSSTILASARSFATADQRLFSVGIRCAR
ncbi:MAG: SUMF1/EgtB/PvdO family nonheme iron enzyme [Polyangiaceae bacterium]|nr:SUMF1/EgtB/PvdO family nonheme iron enzyme [Polyangiaceae bacterium]